MNNDSKFHIGFLMGLLVGGGAVFLLGTRTGKNLLKIMSEQGLDGILNLLEEYNFENLEEYEEVENEEDADFTKESPSAEASEGQGNGESNNENKSPKKRFFKRVRR